MIIIAGYGYIGQQLGHTFQKAGHDFIGLSRKASAPTLACDLTSEESVNQLASSLRAANSKVDAIVHCASSGQGGIDAYRAIFIDGLTHLSKAFPTAQLTFTSSTGVYGQTDGSTVTEDSPTNATRETAQILLEAEQLTLRHGGTVARLAGIYGHHRSFVLKRFLEGSSRIEVSPTSPDGRILNQIHRDDAALALAHLTLTKTSGLFNLCDNAPLTQRDCLNSLASHFDLPIPPEGKPNLASKRGWTHKAISNAKIRKTGWLPKFPSYLDALTQDSLLIPSIEQQLDFENQ